MRASIAEAARSADAMRDVAEALTAQTKAVNANLRAYITLGFGGVAPQNKDTGWKYEVRLTVQNVGNTPANNVALDLYADLLPLPLPADFKISEFDKVKAAGAVATVGPHQSMFGSAYAPRMFTDEEINEMKHGNKKLLFVFGTVTYEDIFGVSRYNKICQVILWVTDDTPSSRNLGNYNESN